MILANVPTAKVPKLTEVAAQPSATVFMPHGKLAGIFKAPIHFLGSIPVAAVSLVAPPVGRKYVRWRKEAEQDDLEAGRDTAEKAKIDLASQTIAVKGVLRIWGIKT